ncbi:MAG: AsmA family protein, partial [Betaproteobacteria bacterium]
MRWARLLVRIALAAGATSVIVFLLLVLALRVIVVPRIGDYRDEITAMIGKNAGRSVTIGQIEAGWDGWSPTLRLIDFKLMDQAGNQALALPQIETSVSWRSIVAGEIRLRRLEVSGPQLLIRRDRQGHLFVGGMDLEQQPEQQDSAAAEWFAKQPQVSIRDGTLLWQDEMRGAPPLRLEQV